MWKFIQAELSHGRERILAFSLMYLIFLFISLTYTKKHQRFLLHFFWWLIYLSALLPFYIVMNFFGWFGENTPLQRAIASLGTKPLFLILPGIGLSLLSLYVFEKRKSYVET